MTKNLFLSNRIKGLVLENQYEIKKVKTGEKMIGFDDLHIIDKDQKTSIYKIKSLEESLYELSPSANKIYHYIIHHLGRDKDRISLPSIKIREITKIKAHTTFYKGINELKKSV